ncbi:MAG: DNA repair protein RecO [Desulfatiglandales bacterium]
MSRFNIEAFVIRTTRMAESSRVVTLFSREVGKVKAVAKGIGRPKSKMGGSIGLFNLIEGVLYKKETSNLGTLSSASLLQDFKEIVADSRKFGFGSAWCEILDKTSHAEESQPKTFTLTLDYLGTLNESIPEVCGLLFWSGVVKLLEIEGYAPRLDRCVSCRMDKVGGRLMVSLGRGGLVCAKCAESDELIIDLSEKVLALLRRMESQSLTEISQKSHDKKIGKEAAEVIMAFATYHLGLPRNLKSFKFLESLGD